MAQVTIPAAANQFFKDTEKINLGVRALLEAEEKRAEELQRAIQVLKTQLDAAEASRLQVIELTNSAQKLLVNSQAQLGGLVGAVESLLTGGGLNAVGDEAPAAASSKTASENGKSGTENGKAPELAGAVGKSSSGS